MDNQKLVYVIDTNILIDYTDIIPSPENGTIPLEEPTVDLSEAHLIIPSVVIRELSGFKKEKSERGRASRRALDRLDALTEPCREKIIDAYEHGISVNVGKQRISVMPVHKDFWESLPFHPADDDNDGQIILAALTVQFLQAGLEINGTERSKYGMTKTKNLKALSSDNLVLLTNDKGLRIRARERGIRVMRYGYKSPAPYTGRRDIFVPLELFMEFYVSRGLPTERFAELMPKEPPLVANEFIVMKLENPENYPNDFDPDNTECFNNIARYDAEKDMLVHLRYVRNFPVRPKNPGQAIYAEALMNPKFAAIICTGPAGSGKTFMATIYGYKACQKGDFIGVTVVPCESRSKLGALPGNMDEKMDPDVQPLKNALRNYLLREDDAFRKKLECIRKSGSNTKTDDCSGESDEYKPSLKQELQKCVESIWDGWFSNVPIESARGRDFAYELAIYDEFQDQNAMQADTLLKRLGEDGKIVLTGDIHQIHSAYLDTYNNGLVYASRQLYNNPMVAQVCFLEDEVIRHPLVKLIAKRQEASSAIERPSTKLED